MMPFLGNYFLAMIFNNVRVSIGTSNNHLINALVLDYALATVFRCFDWLLLRPLNVSQRKRYAPNLSLGDSMKGSPF